MSAPASSRWTSTGWGASWRTGWQGDAPVVGIEQRWRTFDLPMAVLGGQVGILVRSTRREAPSGAGPWAARDPVGVVTRQRDGQPVETYRLYRVVAGGTLPNATVLPRR